MGSAFLGSFQTTFIADRVHHDLTLAGKKIGHQHEQDRDDAQKQEFQPPRPAMQLQAIKCKGDDKQRGHQQHHAGIAQTVKGLEELHCEMARRKSANSYDACSVEGQG